MAFRNYISDSVPIDDSIDWIVSEVEKASPNMDRGTYQFGLPGMESFSRHISGPRFFIIANGTIIDGDAKNTFSLNLESGIEEIERSSTEAIIVCFRKNDYKKFSSIMKEKTKHNFGITPGWGSKHYIAAETDYSVYVFGRNPTRAPIKY